MQIRLSRMPFKFNTPDGPMEITVRSDAPKGQLVAQHHYAAAASFIGHGPRALDRIQVTDTVASHREVLKTLKVGFKVKLGSHEKGSLGHRVLTALSTAEGVVNLDD